MPDPFYPSVDLDFIGDHLIASGKFEESGTFKVGSTTAFVLKGNQAIYKRIISIRELEPGQVCFEQASGLAARFSFIGALLHWLEVHRNWKEGAYIEREDASDQNY